MQSWSERSDNVIGQGCCTFSKHRQSYIHGGNLPTHVSETDGLRITCHGRQYIDCGGLGSGILDSRNNYSLPSIYEVELAEALKIRLGVDRIKFLKTGSDACMQACRFARAFTGRSHIVWSGYHGTADVFISQESPGAGCPHYYSTKLKNIHDLAGYTTSKVFAEQPPAAVIWEPVILDCGPGVEKCNHTIIDQCRKHRVISIMDEVVTGGRVPHFTVMGWWDLHPDLIVMGKALGNGVPLALIGGRAAILDNREVFCSNTHNGSEDAMLAGINTLNKLTDDTIQLLWDIAGLMISQFNKRAEKAMVPVRLKGIPTRFTWTGTPEDISKFWQEMEKEGFWCAISMFPKMNWIEAGICEAFVEAAQRVMDRWGSVTLQCEPAQPWFRRY